MPRFSLRVRDLFARVVGHFFAQLSQRRVVLKARGQATEQRGRTSPALTSPFDLERERLVSCYASPLADQTLLATAYPTVHRTVVPGIKKTEM